MMFALSFLTAFPVPDMKNPADKLIPLKVELPIIVVCKLLLIFAMWWIFFSPDHRPEITADTVGDRIAGEAQTAQHSQPTSNK
ncbi:MAG: hypothetical protein ACFWTZ_05990 [Burkholderia sp.]|jgi:hypothetical protein